MKESDLTTKAELNLKLLIWIKALSSTWFWLGIWILYYLKFTDYTGIGLLESIAVIIGVTLEIPAGMTSDKFGHRYNLIIFAILSLVGFSLFAIASSFWFLLIAVIIARGAGAFSSGSFEALVHESLNHLKRDSEYQSYISKASGLSLVIMALSALIGGFGMGL